MEIKKEIISHNLRIVLLEVPVNIKNNQNVMAIDSFGVIVWKIGDTYIDRFSERDCPFINIELLGNKLMLWNWCGYCLTVNPTDGNVLSYEETK